MAWNGLEWHLVAEIQEGRAQQGVIPIKDDHRLMLWGLLRLRCPEYVG
jgi:hypothetical protein